MPHLNFKPPHSTRLDADREYAQNVSPRETIPTQEQGDMSYLVIPDSFLDPLLGDEELAAFFTADADMDAMLDFEAALAESEAAHGVIPAKAAKAIAKGIDAFAPLSPQIERDVMRDGLIVPGLVAQLRAELDQDTAQYLHFGATSQDVIDTSLMLRLKEAANVLFGRLAELDQSLADLHDKHGNKPLMARTRMQAALPITVGDRIESWRVPLSALQSRLTGLLQTNLPVQFGGPAGTLDKLGEKGPAVRRDLAERLGLCDPGRCWHTDRTVIVDWGTAFSLITGSLGKMGQDIALMSQNGIDEVTIEGGGTSSAMPHKANPVNAEILVSLARFNATLLPGLHQSLVHEQERSGAAWTLEWLIFPQMCLAAGAATRLAGTLLSQITFTKTGFAADASDQRTRL
jgi:3-carboxy-cis,cis-muconate cycloisomerase